MTGSVFMKIAIVGHAGYIGGYLLRRFSHEPGIDTILKLDQTADADEYLDLSDLDGFRYESLDGVDFVVFTAAISSPDKCASEYDFCWRINVTGTSDFIRQAISRNCKVLFFSSDAVFGDIPGTIYDEQSDTKPVTAYGQMKKAVEDQFREEPNFKAIRLSYVVSSRDRFVSYCLNCIQNEKEADVFHPFYRNCITVDDVVNTVVWFSKHWEEYKPSVLNVAGVELVSRVRIADELNRFLEGALSYRISRPDQNFYLNRPALTQMRSLYLVQYGILRDQSFTEKMRNALEEVKI